MKVMFCLLVLLKIHQKQNYKKHLHEMKPHRQVNAQQKWWTEKIDPISNYVRTIKVLLSLRVHVIITASLCKMMLLRTVNHWKTALAILAVVAHNNRACPICVNISKTIFNKDMFIVTFEWRHIHYDEG